MTNLKLYSVIRNWQNVDYDEYEGAVIACENKKEALKIFNDFREEGEIGAPHDEEGIEVTYIGIAAKDTKKDIILSAFKYG